MDYEQDDVFPSIERSRFTHNQIVELTTNDLEILGRLGVRLEGGDESALTDDRTDYKIAKALARARAKGVIPKMQPLAVWLEAAGSKPALPALPTLPLFDPQLMEAAIANILSVKRSVLAAASWEPAAYPHEV